MNGSQIAEITSREIDKRLSKFIDNQYLRGVVSSVTGSKASLYIEGSLNVTPDIPIVKGYVPLVGEKVLIVNIGRTGANMLVVGGLDDTQQWTAVTFTNGWVNYGGEWDTGAYMRDVNGIVHLKGLIKSGTVGADAFVLPVGYRPAMSLLLGTISNNAIGRVKIGTNGGVRPETPSVNGWVALDGLTFKAVQ